MGSQRSFKNVDPGGTTEQRYTHDLLPRHVSSARIFAYSAPARADGDLDPLFSVEGLTRAAEGLLKTLEKEIPNDEIGHSEKLWTDEETKASISAL